jgi:phosphoglycerate dehydrogenase-like enzyme
MKTSLHYSLGVMLLIAAHCMIPPAFSAGPDPDALTLINELQLQETSRPIRESGHWKRPEKVVVFLPDGRRPARDDFQPWLQAAAGDATLMLANTREVLEREKQDADVLLGFCFDVTEDMWNLRWVQNYFVGIDRCTDNELLLQGEVLLTNTKAVPGPGMAEHVMAMMLMLTHKMHVYYRQQLNSEWRRIENPSSQVMEIGGKTMLIVGLGGIGTQVAKRAHGLGMRVIATRNTRRSGPEYVEYVGLADELLTLAKQADVIVNVTPLTKETTGLFDRAFFKAMKPTAYFINIGRGKSVVTDDLMAALQHGELAGAGLDVTDPEPLPKGHALWAFPNVVITPHSSSPSDHMLHRFWTLVRENLRRYTAGEPMLNVVDVKRGY